jgi:hypothetical protein
MKTHFMFINSFFLNRDVYETTWENFVEQGRPRMTIWRMHIVCWISEATNTHSDNVIIITLPLQQCLHERASMLRGTHIDCPVFIVFQHYP